MVDYIQTIIDSLSGFGTMGALIWGIIVYKQEQSNKRKELAFKMLTDIENNDKIRLAMAILDDFVVRVPESDTGDVLYEYKKSNLEKILIDHRLRSESYDVGELKIRESFDILLGFFDKLALQLSTGALKKKEIDYFRPYIEKMKSNDAINNYARIYNFVNYLNILSKFN